MATAAVITPSATPTHTPQTTQLSSSTKSGPQDVNTVLHYYKPNEDGSPPHPTYVNRPETYERPTEPHPVTVRDIRGREKTTPSTATGSKFTLIVPARRSFWMTRKSRRGIMLRRNNC